MKRPLLVAVLSMVGGEIVASEMDIKKEYVFIIGIFFLVFVLISFKLSKGVLCLLIVFSLTLGYFRMDMEMGINRQIEALEDEKSYKIVGEAGAIEKKYDEAGKIKKIYVNVFTDSLIEKDYVCRLYVKDKEAAEDIREGNQIEVTGVKKAFRNSMNPGNFDEKKYRYSQGISMYMEAETVDITDSRYDEIKYLSAIIKQKGRDILNKICDKKEAGIYLAMLFGDKSEMDTEVNESFKNGGISHILAISGMHISILGMGLYTILRHLFMPEPSAIISTVFMVVYGILTGGSVSATRAIIMFLINLLAQVTGRVYDVKSSVSLCAILMLFYNPNYIYNNSFLLSFGAVVAIGFIVPEFSGWIDEKNKILSYIKSFLITTISVNIVNAPILANTYYELSTYGIVLNFIVLPLMSLVVFAGIASMLISVIFVKLGIFFVGPGVYILRLYIFVCEIVSNIPYSRVITGHFKLWQLVLYYITVLVITWYVHWYKEKDNGKVIAEKGKINIICVVGIVFFLHIGIYNTNIEKNKISFAYVGQGECSLYTNDRGNVYIFDCGSTSESEAAKYNILPYIKYSGIKKITGLILTHSDSDHINGVLDIIEDDTLNVDNLFIPVNDDGFEEIKKIAENKEIKMTYIEENMSITEENMRIDFLNPPIDYEPDDINDNSIVALIKSGDISILMTGDISEEVERKIINNEQLGKVDILKVAHHGSKYSSTEEFLKKIEPKISVISCAEKNKYGHPHKETISRLMNIDTKIFKTYENGMVEVKWYENGKSVKCSYYVWWQRH